MTDTPTSRAAPDSSSLIREVLSRSADHISVVSPHFQVLWSSRPDAAETLLELIHPEDVPHTTAAFRRVLSSPAAMEIVTYRRRNADGDFTPVESIFRNCLDEPAIGGILVNTRTLTGLPREDRRQRAERGVEGLIEQLPQAVAICLHDRVRSVNHALETLTGSPRSALIGERPLDLITRADHPRASAMLSGGPGAHSGAEELRLAKSDGSLADVELSVVRIPLDGETATVLFMNDITDRKAMQARMSYTDRMASVGTLAAGVAHEVNNPLAFMTMNLAFISEELERIAAENNLTTALTDVLSALRDARTGCTRVRQVVRDLRTFSRADHEARTSVDVVQVIETCLSMVRNEVRHRAQLVKELEPVPEIMANHAQLAQVFLNLLLNAAQAIREGDAAHNEIRVTVRARDGHILISVRDTGSGIDAEVLPRIFDPFFTTKPVGMGTGLGLAISHNVVTSLGGTINVETQEGRGSTFTIDLPTGAPVPRSIPPPTAPRRTKLLIVDDDPGVGLSLTRAMRDAHDVSYVDDARKALELIRRNERFDVILCDLLMPDMSGSDLYEAISTAVPEQAQRFIFMTAGAFTRDADRFFRERARWRIEKPFSVDQAEAVIAKMLSAAP